MNYKHVNLGEPLRSPVRCHVANLNPLVARTPLADITPVASETETSKDSEREHPHQRAINYKRQLDIINDIETLSHDECRILLFNYARRLKPVRDMVARLSFAKRQLEIANQTDKVPASRYCRAAHKQHNQVSAAMRATRVSKNGCNGPVSYRGTIRCPCSSIRVVPTGVLNQAGQDASTVELSLPRKFAVRRNPSWAKRRTLQ